MPSPATVCILNVGLSGAKVESVMSEFLQLREEGNFRDLEATLEGDVQVCVGRGQGLSLRGKTTVKVIPTKLLVPFHAYCLFPADPKV